MVIKKLTILIVDDDPSIGIVLQQAFQRLGYNSLIAENFSIALTLLTQYNISLIITDIMMPDTSGFDFIDQLKKYEPNIPIIAISALSTLSTTVEIEKKKVLDYFPKSFNLEALTNSVQQVLQLQKTVSYNFKVLKENESLPLVGQSKVMQKLYRMIARLMCSDLTVVISGESGTGKELVAKILHQYGNQKKFKFNVLNLAILTDDKIEKKLINFQSNIISNQINNISEHEKFGTLFLDDISELSLLAQTHLLKFLEKDFSLSSNKEIKPRIIASSKKNLQELVKKGLFREDLYYFLNIASLHLPPLRERKEDIPLLIQHFLKNNPEKIYFSEQAMTYLINYAWPGNIRELNNIIKRLTILYPYQMIQVEFVKKILHDSIRIDNEVSSLLPLSKIVENHLYRYFIENKGQPISNLYNKIIAEVEFPLIKLVLSETDSNQVKAASMLGINRNTLRKKMKNYNLLEGNKRK